MLEKGWFISGRNVIIGNVYDIKIFRVSGSLLYIAALWLQWPGNLSVGLNYGIKSLFFVVII